MNTLFLLHSIFSLRSASFALFQQPAKKGSLLLFFILSSLSYSFYMINLFLAVLFSIIFTLRNFQNFLFLTEWRQTYNAVLQILVSLKFLYSQRSVSGVSQNCGSSTTTVRTTTIVYYSAVQISRCHQIRALQE